MMTSAPAAAGSRGAAVSAPAGVGGFGGNVFPAEPVGMMDKFNDWGGRECNIFVPVFGENGTKVVPTGDRFDQPSGQMR